MEIDIEYKGHFIKGQRLDLIAEDSVIVENKVVGEVLPIHKMALLSSMNAAQTRAG